MWAEFSEKECEIFLTREMINFFKTKQKKFNIYIPSQKKEKYFGADSQLINQRGKIMLLQYKVPYEYSGGKNLSTHRTFKVRLHSNNNYSQNSILSKINKKGGLGLYVVPLFSKAKELRCYFHNDSIINESQFIKARPKPNNCNKIVYSQCNAAYHCEEIKTDVFKFEIVLEQLNEMNIISIEELCKELNIGINEFLDILRKNNIVMLVFEM